MEAGRPVCIGRGVEGFAALPLRIVADNEIARDEIDLFPVIMHEWRDSMDARIETQEPGAAAGLAALADIAGNNLLLDPPRLALRRPPAAPQTDPAQFASLS